MYYKDKHLTWAPEWLQDAIALVGLLSFFGWVLFAALRSG